MKRKSPKNHRLKKRAIARKDTDAITGEWTFIKNDAPFFYDGSSQTITTINVPSSSFGDNGFVTGDTLTISNWKEPKRSKKVHVARRRISKQNNNGEWMITGIDGNDSMRISDLDESTITIANLYEEWKLCVAS